MTKKKKHALAIVAVTVIWVAALETIAYAAYLGYRDVRDEIAVLKVQAEDSHDRLVLARAELGICHDNVDRQIARANLAEFYLHTRTYPTPEAH